MTIDIIKKELQHVFGDNLTSYLGKSIEECSETYIKEKFYVYVKENSQKIKIKDLIDNHTNSAFLINTPDGYQEVGDFYIKSKRDIFLIQTVDGFRTKCSGDHKFETLDGWKFSRDISKKDFILTKNGYKRVTKITKYKKQEDVYDFEVLHENHRYWSGNGMSSHNTGKTYLAMSIVRNAQTMDYFPIYYDSEGAIDVDFVKRLGVDTSKFRIENIGTVEEFTTMVAKLIETLNEIKESGKIPPKIIVVLDSLGSLSSSKEKADAISGSDKRDMTKQQAIRKTFRVLGNDFAKHGIPFIICNHVYACLLGENNVLMQSGEYKQIKDITKGEYVITLDGPKEVIETFMFSVKKLIEVEFEDGKIITCTPGHKFMSEKYGKRDWMYIQDLNVGDEIITTTKNMSIISKTEIISDHKKVYDIEVADAHHYILDNGIVSHNSIGSYIPGNTISGGGGGKYSPSIIFTLTKSKLADKDSEEHVKKHGIETTKVGLVITVHPFKQRFARPIKVQIHIPFYKKPNPFVGLEKFVTWESCGVVRGKMITQKEHSKLSSSEQKICYPFQSSKGEQVYALPKSTARTLVCRHLGGEIALSQLYTEAVFTNDVLKQLDDNVIRKMFELPSIESLEDLEEFTDELSEDLSTTDVDNTLLDGVSDDLNTIFDNVDE